jgi:uncharacterized protein (TIGR03663 family)
MTMEQPPIVNGTLEKDLRHLGPAWLTVESGLYLLFILLGAFIRFYSLGTEPLHEKEAQLALDAWRFYQGGAANIRGHSPLLFHASVLFYLLWGARDFVVRIPPAAAGTAMIAMPYLLRPRLGRRAALAGSALIAFSPSFVFFSRQANGEIIMSAASLALVSGFFSYAGRGSARQLYVVSAGLGFALLASGASSVLLVLMATFLLVSMLRRRAPEIARRSPLRGWLMDTPGRDTILRSLCLFMTLVVLLSTGLLVNLHGIQSILDLFTSWFAQFQPAADSPPWHYYSSLLLAYELPVLVFGLVGASYLYRRGAFYVFLIAWTGLSLVAYSAMGSKPPSGILLALLPLTLLAARAIGNVLDRLSEGEQWMWAKLVLLTSIPALFLLLLQLAAFGDPTNPGDPTALILVLLSAFFLLLLVVTVGLLSQEWRTSLRSGAMVVLLLFGGLMLRTSWRLNHALPTNPYEILQQKTTSTDVRNLTRALGDFSNQEERQRHTIDIAVTGNEEPLLAWYLKDFHSLSFVPEGSSPPATVVITPFPSSEQLPDYRGARFRVQSSWRGLGMATHDLVNWFLFRESIQPPEHREVVMWVAPEEED